MKNTLVLVPFFISSMIFSAATHAAVISLSVGVGSTPAAFSSSMIGTLNDRFAYDERHPVAHLPQQTYTPANAYHANTAQGVASQLVYELNREYTVVPSEIIVVDLYGRDFLPERDNNIDVLLYNGTTVVARINGVKVDGPNHYARATFSALPEGSKITHLKLIGHDSDSVDRNYFTLQEVRMATVPVIMRVE